jgi:flagellar basal-body rod protein FlgF
MDGLIYTAVSGMNASMQRQRMIASNMANSQTIGFRAETMQFTPQTLTTPSDGENLEVRAMTSGMVKGAMMKAGSLTQTGRELDLALAGDAMLTVQAPDGGEGYTRRGDLSVSASGLVQNGEGLPVIGENGPITVPLGSRISIAPDGAVMASNSQSPDQPPVKIERLKLANWRGSKIEKDLNGLFRVPGENGNFGVLPLDEDARVMTGTLEQSNVNPSDVLVEMVEAQRLYDMRTKLVATAKEIDEHGAQLMRLNT